MTLKCRRRLWRNARIGLGVSWLAHIGSRVIGRPIMANGFQGTRPVFGASILAHSDIWDPRHTGVLPLKQKHGSQPLSGSRPLAMARELEFEQGQARSGGLIHARFRLGWLPSMPVECIRTCSSE